MNKLLSTENVSVTLMIISPEVTDNGCSEAPPLFLINIIISTSCGPASPIDYQNLNIKLSIEILLTQVFKHLKSFHHC